MPQLSSYHSASNHPATAAAALLPRSPRTLSVAQDHPIGVSKLNNAYGDAPAADYLPQNALWCRDRRPHAAEAPSKQANADTHTVDLQPAADRQHAGRPCPGWVQRYQYPA
ncbi:unnamed protein product [Phytophthora lilii]|uniref:Unnamed protein product n=1 Tax=Phytophthora lilii TaxID=2077276 RepID=A0A9W6WX48_9STRA|nr:unnamed protein product [Phytophthora lilii]